MRLKNQDDDKNLAEFKAQALDAKDKLEDLLNHLSDDYDTFKKWWLGEHPMRWLYDILKWGDMNGWKEYVDEGLAKKIDLLGKEAVSGESYHFPYYLDINFDELNKKINAKAYTITLDNTKTLNEAEYSITLPFAKVEANPESTTAVLKSINIDGTSYQIITDIEGGITIKGVVQSQSELPTDPSLGDTYYVIDDTKLLTYMGTVAGWYQVLGTEVDLSKYVTTDTEQTLTGKKTFSKTLTVNAGTTTHTLTDGGIVITDSSWDKSLTLAPAGSIIYDVNKSQSTAKTYTYTLPTKSGTIALTNDIPNLYVHYIEIYTIGANPIYAYITLYTNNNIIFSAASAVREHLYNNVLKGDGYIQASGYANDGGTRRPIEAVHVTANKIVAVANGKEYELNSATDKKVQIF